MQVKDYIKSCIKFAADTDDNAHGGLDVSWAFHESPEYIMAEAPQRFIDEIAAQLEQAIGETYNAAEEDLRRLMEEIWQREDKEIIEQAIYYQNIIIDSERHMPLPMEQNKRKAGSYNVHRYTQDEYHQAKSILERLLQS